jgi:hypothetical protein
MRRRVYQPEPAATNLRSRDLRRAERRHAHEEHVARRVFDRVDRGFVA